MIIGGPGFRSINLRLRAAARPRAFVDFKRRTPYMRAVSALRFGHAQWAASFV
jgi:hypothetical protein